MKKILILMGILAMNLSYANQISSAAVSPAPQTSASKDASTQEEQDDEIIMEEDNEDSYEVDDEGETDTE